MNRFAFALTVLVALAIMLAPALPAAATAQPRIPAPPTRTVVPERPDFDCPSQGVTWEEAGLRDAAQAAAPDPSACRATWAEPDVSIKIVVSVGGESSVVELPRETTLLLLQALAPAIPPSERSAAPGAAPLPSAPCPPTPVAADARGWTRGDPAVMHPAGYSIDPLGVYRVQVGAFSNAALALGCFDRLRGAGFDPRFERIAGGAGSTYRVVLPGVGAADVPSVARRLGDAGFSEALIRREN